MQSHLLFLLLLTYWSPTWEVIASKYMLKCFPMFFSSIFKFQISYLSHWTILNWFFIRWESDLSSIYYYVYQVSQQQSKGALFSPMYVFGPFVKFQIVVVLWIYFWILFLFHPSTCLFLCHYCVVFVSVAL